MRRERPTRSLIRHFCSTRSLTAWIGEFTATQMTSSSCVETVGGLRHEIEFLPGHLDGEQAANLITSFPMADLVVIHPAHETLVRDAELSHALSCAGVPTFTLSVGAAQFGVDKLATRDALIRAGLAVVHSPADRSTTRILKSRNGTQGTGMRLIAPGEPARPHQNEYVEQFVHGTEYSVNVYRDDKRTVVFPVVWKGETRLDLLPPYNRTRLCGAERAPEHLKRSLCAQAVHAVQTLNVIGIAEVESVVAGDGVPRILEVNPRISGTLRMSAMSAEFGFLDLFGNYLPVGEQDLRSKCVAVEQPYDGEPFLDVANGVIATSRLTLTATSETLAMGRLRAITHAGESRVTPELRWDAGGASDRQSPLARELLR